MIKIIYYEAIKIFRSFILLRNSLTDIHSKHQQKSKTLTNLIINFETLIYIEGNSFQNTYRISVKRQLPLQKSRGKLTSAR